MKLWIARIKGVFYFLIGVDWIVSLFDASNPVPIYIVREEDE